MVVTVVIFYGFTWNHYKSLAQDNLPQRPNFEFTSNKQFLNNVKQCVDYVYFYNDVEEVNLELLLAQAALESGWGNSRFAKEGNNLFGVMTFNLDEPHLKPKGNKNSKFGAKIYQNKCESVKDYIIVLNTGTAFQEFRELRFQMLKNNDLDVLVLVKTLTRYATNPNYTKLLIKTIKSLRNERISDTD